ncbi:uncharacterized protein ACIGJ3_000907 isoform 2-T2 [Trichechus inunguis]
MGSCSEDPHLYWVSWLLGFFILLGVQSTGAKGSGTKDSEAFVSLKEIQGGFVLFHVIMKPGVDPRAVVKEITWSFGHLSDYRVMLHVYNGTDSPKWVSLHDKYKQRIYMPNMTTLMIENLTLGDSGEYQARVTLPEGREYIQTFRLIVYETIPLPQVLTKYLSTTHGWCNVTLECNVSARATENLNIIWESKGLLKDLEQRETPRPDTNPWTLAVSLPLSQPQSKLSASITCVVSNPKDQKNATLDLGEVCVREDQQSDMEHRGCRWSQWWLCLEAAEDTMTTNDPVWPRSQRWGLPYPTSSLILTEDLVQPVAEHKDEGESDAISSPSLPGDQSWLHINTHQPRSSVKCDYQATFPPQLRQEKTEDGNHVFLSL